MKSGEYLSRSAGRLLERLLWYRRKYGGPVHPRQEKLANGLGVTDRQVRTWLAELRRFCTDQCPDRCCAGNGHVGLVEVHQNGKGRSASYTMNCRDDFRADFRAGSLVESPQQTANESITDENFRAEPPPVVFSSHGSLEHYPIEQHYSPLVNDADCAKSPPSESQKPNPKPGSGGPPTPAYASEVAEIREALKARPLVRYDSRTFDPVIREMLASGETVETIKRAVLRGNWLKLAGRDRAARMGVADTSLIFSMRYFLGVIADVKPIVDPGYWRNLERRRTFVLRKYLCALRSHLSLPSRKPQLRPDGYPLILRRGGRSWKQKVKLSEHPGIVRFVMFDPPGRVAGRTREQATFSIRLIDAFIFPDMAERLAGLGADAVEDKVMMNAMALARMIAKIAHSFAVAELGADAFEDTYVTHLIGGDAPDWNYWVGGYDRGREIQSRELHELA